MNHLIESAYRAYIYIYIYYKVSRIPASKDILRGPRGSDNTSIMMGLVNKINTRRVTTMYIRITVLNVT